MFDQVDKTEGKSNFHALVKLGHFMMGKCLYNLKIAESNVTIGLGPFTKNTFQKMLYSYYVYFFVS